MQRSSNLNRKNSAEEVNIDLRLVHATVVEDETGVCKSQAGLLRLQIELHDLVVTCRKCVHSQDKSVNAHCDALNSGLKRDGNDDHKWRQKQLVTPKKS